MRTICIVLLSAALLFACPVAAQTILNGPESVAYDSVSNSYFVSNWRDGKIIQVDSLGNESIFYEGLGHCLGNQLVDSILYVTTGPAVAAININTATVIRNYTLPTGNGDGLTVDTSGNLYVLETVQRKIYKFIIGQGLAHPYFANLPVLPQDVIFDIKNNRLLICCYSANSALLAISLTDSSASVPAYCPFGYCDGITIDKAGNIYVSASSYGAVYRFDSTLVNPAECIATGLGQPAGLDYNLRDDIVAVPNFSTNVLTLIDLSQPDLSLTGYNFDYSAGDSDGDGHADPGESVLFETSLHNARHATENLQGVARSLSPNISLADSILAFGGELEWGDNETTLSPIEITVSGECPDPFVAPIEIQITCNDDYALYDTAFLFIGDTKNYESDCESSDAWYHRPQSSGFGDEWHLSTDRFYEGTTGWKAGAVGAGDYGNGIDGGLITLPLLLAPNSILSFYHWIDTEMDAGGVWDAATVWICEPGGPWNLIEPIGGYPYLAANNQASPIPGGTPCFGGAQDWSQAQFDLSAYSGIVQILFRFTSDLAATAEGWYIDDVSILGDPDWICGDANADLMANVGDAVYIINYVFRGGPAPLPLEAGDANCDLQANVGDAVYIINYVFRGGSAPCANCK